MNIQRWIKYRQPDWQRLEASLKTIEQGGLATLPQAELQTLGGLYRQVSADLAKAQMHQMGADLTNYLQSLTLRAHNQVYQPPVVRAPDLGLAWLKTLPDHVRALGVYIALSCGIFLLGSLTGAILYLLDDNVIQAFLPPDAITNVTDNKQLWTGSLVSVAPLSSSWIMANNITVAFTAFAGGIVFGLGTLYILFSNGVMLGAIGLFIAEYGMSYPFWGFVLPHGVPELSAIFLAGAAGLMLGKATLAPWPYLRGDALKIQARRAVPLLVTVFMLLIFAGLIEGFISPSELFPEAFKYLWGLIELILLTAYVIWGGRKVAKISA